MASFLGDSESLMLSTKRKRSRSGPADKGDGPFSSSIDSEDPEISHTKKKRKKEKKSKKEPEMPVLSVVEDEDETMDEDEEMIVKEEVEEPGHVDGGAGVPGSELGTETIQMLLSRIEACCAKDSARLMSWSCQQEKLDWDAIAFPQLNAEECKKVWASISTKVRKFRTLPELIADARGIQEQKDGGLLGVGKKKQAQQHPDMPKKPLSGYLRFFLEKRQKYIQKHPNVKGSDFTKLMGKKFTELSTSKKEKYNKEYQQEMEVYRQKMDVFRGDHPELFPESEHRERHRSSHSGHSTYTGPPKPVTAQGMFIQEKIEKELAKDGEQGRRELYSKYQEKWMKKLSSKKKWKYIEMAVEAKKKYDADMEAYCKAHPEYEPKKAISTFLTKAEQKLKDEHDGKPNKPPSNGYQYFTIEVMKTAQNIPSHERMEEAATLWKAMNAEDRDTYQEKCKQLRVDYYEKLSAYVAKLPEEEQAAYESELTKLDKELHDSPARAEKKPSPKKKSSSSTSSSSTTTSSTSPTSTAAAASSKSDRKPVSAMFLFMDEHRDEYTEKHKGASTKEVNKHMLEAYNKLPAKEKDEYKKRAAEHKKQLDDQAQAKAATTAAAAAPQNLKKIQREAIGMGEPQKPAGSGYLLYSKEQLKELTHIDSAQRMKHISTEWKNKTDAERAVYNDKRSEMWKKYCKKLDKFVLGLSKSDRQKYFELKPEMKKKYAKQLATAGVSPESSVESSNEAGSDEDDDKENVDVEGSGDSSSDSSSDDSSDDDDDEEAEDSSDNDEKDQKLVNGTKAGTKDNKLKAAEVFDDSSDDSSDDSGDDSDSDSPTSNGKNGSGDFQKMSALNKSSPSKTPKPRSPIKIAVASTPSSKHSKKPASSSSSSSSSGSGSSSSDSDSD